MHLPQKTQRNKMGILQSGFCVRILLLQKSWLGKIYVPIDTVLKLKQDINLEEPPGKGAARGALAQTNCQKDSPSIQVLEDFSTRHGRKA